MSKPNKKHAELCKKYEQEGRRAKNKAIKQARHEKRLAVILRRREEGRTYKYEKNPYKKGTKEYATEAAIRAEKTVPVLSEFQRYERIYGRLDRDIRKAEEERKKQEFLKVKEIAELLN